jgi:hypothetical protein
MAINSLRAAGRWDAPPSEVTDFGERVGFCERCRTSGGCVFPIARLLASMSAPSLTIAVNLLETSTALLEASPLSEVDLRNLTERILSPYGERIAFVVRAREGLFDTRKLTLEETATALSVSFWTDQLSRERVRQLEAKFWKRVNKLLDVQPHSIPMGTRLFLRPLLEALLGHVMGKRGSLVVRSDSPEGALERFIAKCTGISSAELLGGALALLGASPDDAAVLDSLIWSPDEIDQESVARRLRLEAGLALVDRDAGIVADTMSRYLGDDARGFPRVVKLQTLTKAHKVYLALREIGKPAHYSEVAEVYNSLFPDDATNIHAILGRGQHGVAWIGVKGTYALEEWGYERPSKTLFEAIAEIVEKQYEATGTPVPFAVIAAEMGKLRRVVKPSSLAFATQCNPGLRRVSSDSFVPGTPDDQAEEEFAEDEEELDRILEEFEEDLLGDSPAMRATAEHTASVGAGSGPQGRFARLTSIARHLLGAKGDRHRPADLRALNVDRQEETAKEVTRKPLDTVQATSGVTADGQAGVKRTAAAADEVSSGEQQAESPQQRAVRSRHSGGEQAKGLPALLRSGGLEVVDERPDGGRLWVVGGKELYSFLSPRGFVWGPGGAAATDYRPGWYLLED